MQKGPRFLIIKKWKFIFECRIIIEPSHTGNDMVRVAFLKDPIQTNDFSKMAEL